MITCRGLGIWRNSLTVTSVEDIGRVTTMILLDESVRNEVVFMAGDTFIYEKLADVVGRVTKRGVMRELRDNPFLRDELNANPENAMAKYRFAYAAAKGAACDMACTYNATKGVEMTNVELWLTQYLAK